MKKTLTMLGLLCLLAACKKSSNTRPQNAIIGKWTHTKIILYDDKGNALETTPLNDPKDYIQFNSNGTGINSDDQSGAQVTTNFTYGVSNQTLTLVSSGENDIATIKVLTSNTLVIHEQLTDDNTGAPINQFVDNYYTK